MSCAVAWGDVPTWLTFLATAGALGAAIYAGKKAGDLLEVERERDALAAADRLAEQASQVSAWMVSDPRGAGTRLGAAAYFPGASAVGYNGSSQPVYRVVIAYWREGECIKTDAADLIPPGDTRTWRLPEDVFDNMLGQVGASQAMSASPEQVHASGQLVAERLRIEIMFTDAANRRWTRDQSGILAPHAP